MMSGVPSVNTRREPTTSRNSFALVFSASGSGSAVGLRMFFPGILSRRAAFPDFLRGGVSIFPDAFENSPCRTTPATVLRSAIPKPACPSKSAVSTMSWAGDAPRRKEKFVAATSSA